MPISLNNEKSNHKYDYFKKHHVLLLIQDNKLRKTGTCIQYQNIGRYIKLLGYNIVLKKYIHYCRRYNYVHTIQEYLSGKLNEFQCQSTFLTLIEFDRDYKKFCVKYSKYLCDLAINAEVAKLFYFLIDNIKYICEYLIEDEFLNNSYNEGYRVTRNRYREIVIEVMEDMKKYL